MISTRIPLSAEQHSILSYEILHPGTPAFHHTILFTLDGVNLIYLREALGQLIKRHEMLRYRLEDEAGQYYFSQLPIATSAPESNPLSEFDSLKTLPYPGEEKLLETLKTQGLDELLTRAFVFETEVLWRCGIVHFANQDVFIFVGHHLIIDVSSKNILMRDLTESFNALLEKRPANLPALPELSQVVHPLVDEKKIGFWNTNLNDLSPLTLSTDFMPQSEFTGQAGRFFFTLSQDLTRALSQLATSQAVSIHRVLLTSFFIYLYRITGHPDICVGTASANRRNYTDLSGKDISVEHVVSDFVNTLPIRLSLHGKLSFFQVLQKLSPALVDALKNQIPFETLVTRAMGKKEKRRTTTASPFDFIFDLSSKRTAFEPNEGKAGFPFELRFNHTFVHYLGLNVDERPDGSCRVFIEYNAQLFKPSRIERMAEHLKNLWQNLSQFPNSEISTLPLLSVQEHQALNGAHHTAKPFFFDEMNVVEIFRRTAKRRANHRAVVFHQATPEGAAYLTAEAEVLTYKQLDEQSDVLASVLRSCGIRPDKLVGVSLLRSTKILVALWAIFKAYGVFLPLDTENDERLNSQLKEIQPSIILVDNSTQELEQFKSPYRLFEVINIENWKLIQKRATKQGIHVFFETLQPNHLAYITETSGSTGQPKRPMNTYGAFANCALAIFGRKLKEGCKVLCTAKFNFDAVLFEILEALITGGELHLIFDKGRLSPEVLQQVIPRYNLEAVTLLPQVGDFLDFSQLPSLSDIVLMGAKPKEETLKRLEVLYHQRKNTVSPLTVRLEYGVQESSIFSTDNPYSFDGQPISAIGRPIPNVQLFAVDPWGNECPLDVPGELYIAGLGLARGYFGVCRDEGFLNCYYSAKQHRFFFRSEEQKTENLSAPRVKHTREESVERERANSKRQKPARSEPLSSALSEDFQLMRVYRTGDCVQLGEDGSLHFIGRISGNRQVKIHGVRVELDSIETLLQRHPNISQCLINFDEKAESLKAFVLLKNSKIPMSKSDLNDFLRLFPTPPVARISALFRVNSIPVTSNGKVDAASLERASFTEEKSEETDKPPSFESPVSPLEIKIHLIWEEVLGTGILSVNSSFDELGGDSIDLIKLWSLIRQRICNLSNRELGLNMTIRSLARKLAPSVLCNSSLVDNSASFSYAQPTSLPETHPAPTPIQSEGSTKSAVQGLNFAAYS